MLRIFLKKNANNIFLIKYPSPYSILNAETKIELHGGLNEIHDLPYGFRLSGFAREFYIEYMDLSDYDTSNVFDMRTMFSFYKTPYLDLSNFDTSNVINMDRMFAWCDEIKKLKLDSFNTSKLLSSEYMFCYCSSLEELDLSNFDMSNVTDMYCMFFGCNSLKYIKCKQSFKDWCLENEDEICLPFAMREGCDGIWDIID